MSALMAGLERDERRRRRVTLLVVVSCVTGLGTWLAAPFGVVLLTRGEPIGWLLLAAGAVLLAATVVAIAAARRVHRAPESVPGKANPRFDEPQPSPDPRGGYSTVGSQLGSR
ncbi:hypothetical protein [Leifsonia sp. LS-T14]|uniref:hypothetical protein n=1 Tax=unclassified Leifsonia TaxID=2663824 RepID=UPI0035A5A435